MTQPLRRVWRKTMLRRVALTLMGATVLLLGLWWSQTQMPNGHALVHGIRHFGNDRAGAEVQGASNAPPMPTQTRAADFPRVVIVRPDEAEAAFTAHRFIDALTDAGLYPRIETVLLLPARNGAPCDEIAARLSNTSDPSNRSITPGRPLDGTMRPTLVYAIGACAMRNAIASAHDARSISALGVGDADAVEAMYRLVPLIFSDVDELEARVLISQALSAGQRVRGVLAAPTLATQLQWARRYLPHTSSVRIGYWTNALEPKASVSRVPDTSDAAASNASASSLQDRRLIGLRNAAREAVLGYERVGNVNRDDDMHGENIDADADADADAGGAIEIVATAGRPADAVAHWRTRGVRLLYVDGATPEEVVQAAVAAGIGTFCAADAGFRGAVRSTCLLRVMPLRQAAPAMAAYQASRLLAPQGRVQQPIGSLATLWQAPPQGPLLLDIGLARKLGQMPPLSLLDDVRVVDVDRPAVRGPREQ